MGFFVFRIWISMLLVWVPLNLSAQLIDTIKASFKYTPKLLVKLDTRNSFITTRSVKIRGVKIGANFGDVSKVGLGYEWIQPKFQKTITIHTESGPVEILAKLRLEYLAPFYEYTFYKRKRLEVSIPVQIGIGRAYYRYEVNGKKFMSHNAPIILYEPAMAVLYKPIPWFGFGLGVGYRLMLLRNYKMDETLTSPVYIVKFNLFISYFYNKYFKKEKEESE